MQLAHQKTDRVEVAGCTSRAQLLPCLFAFQMNLCSFCLFCLGIISPSFRLLWKARLFPPALFHCTLCTPPAFRASQLQLLTLLTPKYHRYSLITVANRNTLCFSQLTSVFPMQQEPLSISLAPSSSSSLSTSSAYRTFTYSQYSLTPCQISKQPT